MNAKAKRQKLKKTRIALGINLPICIVSMIIGLQSINSMDFFKIIVSGICFIITLNLIILISQHMIRLQKAD
jgi:hypothetical protein